jgi:hypothetical protein
MKRFITAAIQIILLAPAIVGVPFILRAVPVAIMGLRDHTSSLAEVVFIGSVALSCFAGVVASLVLILSGANRVARNDSLKARVRIGLMLGAIGMCSVLAWITTFIVRSKETHHGYMILVWVLYSGPSIALVTYQFVSLFGTRRPDQEPAGARTNKEE